MVLVTYDVKLDNPGGKNRLRRVAKTCENYGQRVQYSVFECVVDPAKWTEFRHKLEKAINPREDSLRYYFLGSSWQKRVEHVGAKKSYDPETDTLIV